MMGLLKFGLATALLSLGLYTCAFRDYPTANAATASVTYTFSSGQKIVASQINQNYNDILGAINGNLNSDNILDGGVATADLASSAVTTAKIDDSNVTTAKIADGAVTKAKLASATYAASASTTGAFTVGASQSVVAAQASITTTGRPVLMSFVGTDQLADCSGLGSSRNSYIVDTSAGGSIDILINEATASNVIVGSSAIPCSSISYLSQQSSGANTYKVRGRSGSGSLVICNCRLIIQEL